MESQTEIYGIKLLLESGLCLLALHRLEESMRVLEQCRDKAKHVLGENESDHTLSLVAIGMVLAAMDKHDKALDALREHMRIMDKPGIAGKRVSERVNGRRLIATCLDAIGRSAEASKMNEQATAIEMRESGKEDTSGAELSDVLEG